MGGSRTENWKIGRLKNKKIRHKKNPGVSGVNPSEIFFINLFYEEISTLIDEGHQDKVSQIRVKFHTTIRCNLSGRM
jgi:hypothetical protein